MRQRVLNYWHFFRVLRLVLGIMITVQSLQVKEYGFALAGILFAAMAIFNMGCMGGACAVPYNGPKRNHADATAPQKTIIEYEEVGH